MEHMEDWCTSVRSMEQNKSWNDGMWFHGPCKYYDTTLEYTVVTTEKSQRYGTNTEQMSGWMLEW
jgi:hypothetical protein